MQPCVSLTGCPSKPGPQASLLPNSPLWPFRLALTPALSFAQGYSIEVVAVVNDTVGTMMGCEPAVGPCEIGLVVGEPQAVCDEEWGYSCPLAGPNGYHSY